MDASITLTGIHFLSANKSTTTFTTHWILAKPRMDHTDGIQLPSDSLITLYVPSYHFNHYVSVGQDPSSLVSDLLKRWGYHDRIPTQFLWSSPLELEVGWL